MSDPSGCDTANPGQTSGGPAGSGSGGQQDFWKLLPRIRVAVLVFGPQGRVKATNQAAQELLGLSRQRIEGRLSEELCAGFLREDGTPMSPEECPEARVLRNGQPVGDLVIGIQRLGGAGGRWVLAGAVPVLDSEGNADKVVVTLMDVTDRKQAEEALLREKARAENYLAIAGSIIVALDSEHRVSLINQAGCQALGYAREELLGEDWIALVIPPEDRERVHEIFHRLMAGESVGVEHVGDHQVLRKDGVRRWVVWHNTVVRDELGRINGTLSSGEDVTERREAEQRVKTSLQEKEVLLREIHHRVKNNLQVISSLLTLEAHHHRGASGVQLFADTQSRIQAMALVHDKLYQSDNLAMIDLGTYIRDLAAGLQAVNASDHRDVRVVIESDAIGLTVDTAMSCGLVLNELLTNAFKYAFPAARSGEIRVEAHRLEGGQVGILVGDDGVGLPPEIGLGSRGTLGLQLVRAITNQLRGEVAIERDPGTRFRIRFPLASSGPAQQPYAVEPNGGAAA